MSIQCIFFSLYALTLRTLHALCDKYPTKHIDSTEIKDILVYMNNVLMGS